MDAAERLDRLAGLSDPLGSKSRVLRLGDWDLRLEGLDSALAAELQERWGGFLLPVEDAGEAPAVASVHLFQAGRGGWLDRWKPDERYRLEAERAAGALLVLSYHFALSAEGGPAWRAGISNDPAEPRPRIVENLVRYLVARIAVEEGGFALHAAGLLRGGRAYLLAGPSGTGKTTAVRFSEGALSLGDDFALTVPKEEGWVAPALPFDNSERAPADPPRGTFPVAGIWRLFQAPVSRAERPPVTRAAAALMGCAAFPWAMPDLADALLDNVRRFLAEGRFEFLHFRMAPDFWERIGPA